VTTHPPYDPVPVRLNDTERAALAAHLPHHDWCDYDQKGGCGPDFGCGIWKDRAALEATVVGLIEQRLAGRTP
jgi:hypothetical protein